MTTARLTQETVEVLVTGDAKARLTQEYVEVLATGDAKARLTQMYVEALQAADTKARLTMEYVEALGDAHFTYDASASNTLTMTSSGAETISLARTATNTFAPSDSATDTVSLVESATNTLTFSQVASFVANTSSLFAPSQDAEASVTYTRESPQTLSLSQDADAAFVFDRTVEDTITFADEARRTVFEVVPDLIEYTQDVVGNKFVSRTSSQTLTITPTVARSADFVRSATQGYVPTQSLSRTLVKALAVSQTLTITSVATNTLTKLASSTIVYSQDAEVSVGKHVHQTLTITSVAVCETTYNRTLYAVFVPHGTPSSSNTIRPSLTQTLSYTQESLGEVQRLANSTLTFTQLASVEKARSGFSLLQMTEDVSYSRTVGKTSTSLLRVTQAVALAKTRSVAASNAFGINQHATGAKTLLGVTSQSLTYTQQLWRDLTVAAVDDALDLSQDVIVAKYADRSVNQTLTLAQLVTVSGTYNRTVEDTLVFPQIYYRPDGYAIFNAVGIKTTRFTLLRSATKLITLPRPEFADGSSNPTRINIKRAMSGERYVYKRMVFATKLSYDFVIARDKALELRSFLLTENSKQLTLETWNGQVWSVVLTNNPFTTTEVARWELGGNKCTITLEFEGVKI